MDSALVTLDGEWQEALGTQAPATLAPLHSVNKVQAPNVTEIGQSLTRLPKIEPLRCLKCPLVANFEPSIQPAKTLLSQFSK